jgi:hypothetical protein
MRDLANAGGDLAKQQQYADRFAKSWDDLDAKLRKSAGREHAKQIDELSRKYKEFGERGAKVAEFIGKDLTPVLSTFGITALSATGAVTGLLETTKRFAEQASKLENFSRQFGFLTKDIRGLTGAASEFDVSGDTNSDLEQDLSRDGQRSRACRYGWPG